MIRLTVEEYLARKGISKNEFARRLGIPSQAVRPYFRDGYDPKLSTLQKWCKVLDCRVTELVGHSRRAPKRKIT